MQRGLGLYVVFGGRNPTILACFADFGFVNGHARPKLMAFRFGGYFHDTEIEGLVSKGQGLYCA